MLKKYIKTKCGEIPIWSTKTRKGTTVEARIIMIWCDELKITEHEYSIFIGNWDIPLCKCVYIKYVSLPYFFL